VKDGIRKILMQDALETTRPALKELNEVRLGTLGRSY